MATVLAIVHEADGVFGISFPDFQGCISGGDSFEEALERGAAGFATHIAFMAEDGDPMPAIRSYAEIRRDPMFADHLTDAVVAVVEVGLPGKRTRVNITFDETLLAAVDAAAKRAGRTRSDFLEDAARASLKDETVAV